MPDLHNAYAGLFTSMGMDPYRGDALDTSVPVETLAKSLRKLWLERDGHQSGLRVASQ